MDTEGTEGVGWEGACVVRVYKRTRPIRRKARAATIDAAGSVMERRVGQGYSPDGWPVDGRREEALENVKRLSGRDLARMVLECLDSMEWHVGKNKLARILTGSKAKDMTQWGYDKAAHYGELKGLTVAQVEGLVDQLVGRDQLMVSCGRRPVVLITSKGREALATGDHADLEIPDLADMYVARMRCAKCPYNPANFTQRLQDSAYC